MRITGLRTTILTACLVGIGLIARSANAGEPTRRNVLVIDDVATNVHGVGQASPVRTPNIERIASRGTWFTHAYCDAPACCPWRRLGEKDDWLKYARWEQTCQIFPSISVSGYLNQKVAASVSLINLYPTLLDLCGAKPSATHALDGIDLVPMLTGMATKLGKPVLSTCSRGNHAIRDERYRYIRYRNGDDELYDLETDPYEWTDLARASNLNAVTARLATYLLAGDAPDIPEEIAGDGSRWKDDAFN